MKVIKNTETTYTPEYVEDRKRIGAVAKQMEFQVNQLNKTLKTVQIEGFQYKLIEIADIKTAAGIGVKKNLWIKLIKFLAFFNLGYIKLKNKFARNKTNY